MTALHPATFMPTKMVSEAGVSPTSTLEEGVEAVSRLVVDPDLEGVTGSYFNGRREATAHGDRLLAAADRLTAAAARYAEADGSAADGHRGTT